jgi:MFS transporter, SHS family, lactate transporter
MSLPMEDLKALRTHWRIVVAAMAGWGLDAFDFTMLLFLLPHLGKVFGATLPEMAFVVTATGLAKVIGTIVWGAAADRFGRKLPFMVAVLWFSFFSGLSGLAWSYASFIVLRALFGIGFGGEWSASASLLMESIPERTRGVAAGIMMAGYEVGFLLAALCFGLIFPWAGWRVMFFLGIAPALLAIFIRSGIKESPLWLETRQDQQVPEKLRITPAVVQGWAFMAFVNFMLWATFSLYPTFLITVRHLDPAGVFPYIAIYSISSIIGKPLAGHLVERFGERRTLVLYLLLTIPSTLLYTLIDNTAALAIGAVLMGLVANSVFGIVPMYLARRFPPARWNRCWHRVCHDIFERRRALYRCTTNPRLGIGDVDGLFYRGGCSRLGRNCRLEHGTVDSRRCSPPSGRRIALVKQRLQTWISK